MAGVGEYDVRAVPQQQPVGELLIDDADIAGDDDGPPVRRRPESGEPVQHRLDGAADEREDNHLVAALPDRADEFRSGHFPQVVRVDSGPGLGELAGGRGGPAAQQKATEVDVPFPKAARGERAPFPPGVGIGDHCYTKRVADTCWHNDDARKTFRSAAQLGDNKGLTARSRTGIHRGGQTGSPFRHAAFTSRSATGQQECQE